MKPRRTPRSTRLGRFVRGRRPDRNPLRRRLDRLETFLLGGMFIVFLVAVPFVARAAGHWTYNGSLKEQRSQLNDVYHVPALLLRNGVPQQTFPNLAIPGAPARWTAPDGRQVLGTIPVPIGAGPGSTVSIWTDRDGELVNPPLQPYQISERADLTEFWVVTIFAATVLVGAKVATWTLNKRRLASWEADWRATEPRWSSRR